jgi:glycosyltransferase involved in cell wall biosynthesis
MVAFINTLISPSHRNRFHWRGAMEHRLVRQRIAEASLIVVPSRLESFSIVAAEGIELGTPVVVSDQVGVSEYVPSLPCVPFESASELAHAQLAALSDPVRTASIARECLQELRSACDPTSHFANRLAFAAGLDPNDQAIRSSTDHAADDAMEWMDGVLRSIEAEERAASVSSVRS